MSVKDRLLDFVAYTGLSRRKFQERINVSNSYIQNISEGIGADVMNRISIQFPDLNTSWLLTGEGEMLKSSCDVVSQKSSNTRPRIPYDAAAGTLTETVEGVAEYQCEQVPIIGVFPRYDFTIRIVGRSMEPEYFAGDEVACLRVNEKRFLQWGRVHVLDTTQGVVIKRIYDNGDCIVCKSFNPEFPDFSIPKEDIRSYNLVVGSIRL
ncbi:S24 family peptidase [Phocaeicola coprophilus]|uniref:S24 family peptidase n=1 Tax=Phocaeicola coprophilus TaxID=387090 RepID=UPI0026DCC68E|nr:S24 family peptidase [Phocaeicola coprophilus]